MIVGLGFPKVRMRRLRRTGRIRSMVRQVRLSPDDLIYPLFVQEGIVESVPVVSMPNVHRSPVEGVVEDVRDAVGLGIPAVMLFGIPARKDEAGSSAYDKNGVLQSAVRRIKSELGEEVVVITDLCLCEYTVHGHCGVVRGGELVNDETLELLGKIAVSQAESGADVVAPSGMIDGQVKAVRDALDREGYTETAILAYSAKFNSAFYAPFRDAADSTPQTGDRSGYQTDYANPDEAIREIELDIEEGADIVMVKPALPYLDIIHRARYRFKVPIAAYSVSGEYSLVKAESTRW